MKPNFIPRLPYPACARYEPDRRGNNEETYVGDVGQGEGDSEARGDQLRP